MTKARLPNNNNNNNHHVARDAVVPATRMPSVGDIAAVAVPAAVVVVVTAAVAAARRHHHLLVRCLPPVRDRAVDPESATIRNIVGGPTKKVSKSTVAAIIIIERIAIRKTEHPNVAWKLGRKKTNQLKLIYAKTMAILFMM